MNHDTLQRQFIVRRIEELLTTENIGELLKYIGSDPKPTVEAFETWTKIKEEFFALARQGFIGVSWRDVMVFRSLIVANLARRRVPLWQRKQPGRSDPSGSNPPKSESLPRTGTS